MAVSFEETTLLSYPTTFVLGAGASCDFGFPTGEALQKTIRSLLTPDDQALAVADKRIWQAAQPLISDPYRGGTIRASSLYEAAKLICRGMSPAASIDNFLHTHQGNEDVVAIGKLAIAKAIVDAEKSSPLRMQGFDLLGNGYDPLGSIAYAASWYSPFVKMLTMGATTGDPRALFRNAKFIVFNYDRCLELILRSALESYFGLSQTEAAEIIEGVSIIHPYGSLGKLTAGSDIYVPFGDTEPDLLSIAGRLRTFTEAVDSDTVSLARSAIAEAQTLVFLGFGFLPQNMQLLTPEKPGSVRHIHATTHGFSATDKLVISRQLTRFTPPHMKYRPISECDDPQHAFIDVDNQMCGDLIYNHRMRLMQEV